MKGSNILKNPAVSFIVPCYKLAHLLPECINSILSQTYGDFEVLIMDDCSPDNTAHVARSFEDHRIKHVRNEVNLGPLGNYNKGIGLSRGKYVWLISADDYLRQPHILQRYVELMEEHPNVGYTFCPGIGVRDGKESEFLDYSAYGNCDRIVSGHVFLRRLIGGNIILTPSAMVRRECYEKISFFPLGVVWNNIPIDMVWGGDWYLWCVFALFFDVGYFAEPMVCYREHSLSMSNSFTKEKIENSAASDLAVLWMVRQKANESGLQNLSRDCLGAIAHEYSRQCVSKEYTWMGRSSTWSITIDQFEDSLCRCIESESERNWVRARVFTGMADRLYWRGDLPSTRKFLLAGLRKDPRMAKAYVKLLLMSLGKQGEYLRRILRSLRTQY
jgi:glycosyltransferase involved in cell wall biosynthesis